MRYAAMLAERMERHGNASIVIAVRHAPGKAFIMPEQPTALEGKSVTLECGARPPGFPLPTYRWWRGDGSLSAPPANSAVLATGSTYTIDSVRLASGGQYLCQPTNELGSGSVAATMLQVWQEPRLTSQLAITTSASTARICRSTLALMTTRRRPLEVGSAMALTSTSWIRRCAWL